MKNKVFIIIIFIFALIILLFIYFNQENVNLSPNHIVNIQRNVIDNGDGTSTVKLSISQNHGDYSLVIEENSPAQVLPYYNFENIESGKGFFKIEGNRLNIVILSDFTNAVFSYVVDGNPQTGFSGTYESTDGVSGSITSGGLADA